MRKLDLPDYTVTRMQDRFKRYGLVTRKSHGSTNIVKWEQLNVQQITFIISE